MHQFGGPWNEKGWEPHGSSDVSGDLLQAALKACIYWSYLLEGSMCLSLNNRCSSISDGLSLPVYHTQGKKSWPWFVLEGTTLYNTTSVLSLSSNGIPLLSKNLRQPVSMHPKPKQNKNTECKNNRSSTFKRKWHSWNSPRVLLFSLRRSMWV